MTKEIITNPSIFNSQLVMLIMGGVIGFIFSLFTFFVTIFYKGYQSKKGEKIKYEAWLKGLKAEVNHLLFVRQEIEDIFRNPAVTCTKRFNYDYLQNARIKYFEFDNDINFLQSLTNVYRDIVHTNDMMDRLEKSTDSISRNSYFQNTSLCVSVLKTSIGSLNSKLNSKLAKIHGIRGKIIFGDKFNKGNNGWNLKYWENNNPKQINRIEKIGMVFEATESDLIDPRKEFGAFLDLSEGIYEGTKYEVICTVYAEDKTTMQFRLWLHSTRNADGSDKGTEFITPTKKAQKVKWIFTPNETNAIRVHLHNKAGLGKIIVKSVTVKAIK